MELEPVEGAESVAAAVQRASLKSVFRVVVRWAESPETRLAAAV